MPAKTDARRGKQSLCWAYMCPNPPTTTTPIRFNSQIKQFAEVQVCERHKGIKAFCTPYPLRGFGTKKGKGSNG